MSQPLLSCPANYFGRGENYVLPEDVEIIREFEAKFREWEINHPDDPLGEKALAEAKRLKEPTEKIMLSLTGEKSGSVSADAESEMVEVELTMPERYASLLKNYAKFKRRRPRDIVMGWIEQFARL